MSLASESMLSYQGLHGMDGLMHGRVYGEAGHIPVVIAGQPDDNPGTLLAIGIEMAAASIQENLFADGREVRLVSRAQGHSRQLVVSPDRVPASPYQRGCS